MSMVIDHYTDKWKTPWMTLPLPNPEAEVLRKEVQDLKELLKRAKIYDTANNQPDCEKPEKIKLLKEVAKALGIELPELD